MRDNRLEEYDRRVATLAVLADTQPDWRPDGFGYDLWGSRVRLEFPVIKLLEYESRWNLLEESPNPFAVIVMTHLKAQATYRDAQGRLHWKLKLVKMLYHRGYRKEDILELFRFIDWLMVLPEDLEEGFAEAIRQYEEDIKMPYVTSVERKGIQQGIQQGIQEGVQQGLHQMREAVIEILEARFEHVPRSIVTTIHRTGDLPTLRLLVKKAATAGSLKEFRETLQDLQKRAE